jgi:hypothetical protein
MVEGKLLMRAGLLHSEAGQDTRGLEKKRKRLATGMNLAEAILEVHRIFVLHHPTCCPELGINCFTSYLFRILVRQQRKNGI